MIRPITLICWMLVLSSGLYLYRAKHEVELLDRRIVQVARDTEVMRGESRRLLDEWIRLGEPEQLRKYSDQYLGLKSVMPAQFVRIADLGSRLPPPRDPAAEPDETIAPQAAAAPAVEEPDEDDLPVPPVPPAAPIVATAPAQAIGPREMATRLLTVKPADPRAAEQAPKPAAVRTPEQHGPEARPAEPRTADAAVPKPAAIRSAEAHTAGDPRAGLLKPIAVIQSEPHGIDDPRAAVSPAVARPAETRPMETRLAGDPRAAMPKPVPARQTEQRPADDSRALAGKSSAARPLDPAAARPALNQAVEQRFPFGQRTAPANPPAAQGSQAVAQQASQGSQPAAQPAPAPRGPSQSAPGGSLLGMTRGSSALPPPTPVSASWPGR